MCLVIALVCSGAGFTLSVTGDNLAERLVGLGLSTVALVAALTNMVLGRGGAR